MAYCGAIMTTGGLFAAAACWVIVTVGLPLRFSDLIRWFTIGRGGELFFFIMSFSETFISAPGLLMMVCAGPLVNKVCCCVY